MQAESEDKKMEVRGRIAYPFGMPREEMLRVVAGLSIAKSDATAAAMKVANENIPVVASE